MSLFMAAITLATAAALFLMGRLSARVVRDRYLEAKRDELMAIKEGLDEVAEGLEAAGEGAPLQVAGDGR